MLGEFWLKIRIKFITISELILNILLPFHTTDLCEPEFTVVVIINQKYHSIIKNIKDAIYPTSSNILPRYNTSHKDKQAHPANSHPNLP